MADPVASPVSLAPAPPTEREQVHPIQRLMDNPWLLLVLGLVVPFLSYTVWGLYEVMSVKEALLP
jgi:hypothetical protein